MNNILFVGKLIGLGWNMYHQQSMIGKASSLTLYMKGAPHKSFAEDLPEFDESKKYITLYGGEKALVGSIVIRPLIGKVKSELEYHYGVVLGTTKEGVELILELTEKNGVQYTPKMKFLNPKPGGVYPLSYLTIRAHIPNMTREKVIERGKEVEHIIWNLIKFNCKDFAQYCVFGILPSRELILNHVSLAFQYIALGVTHLESIHPANVGDPKLKSELSNLERGIARLTKETEEMEKKLTAHHKKLLEEL